MAKVMILVSPLICRSGLAANWSPLNTKKKISVFLFSFEKERCKKKNKKERIQEVMGLTKTRVTV